MISEQIITEPLRDETYFKIGQHVEKKNPCYLGMLVYLSSWYQSFDVRLGYMLHSNAVAGILKNRKYY